MPTPVPGPITPLVAGSGPNVGRDVRIVVDDGVRACVRAANDKENYREKRGLRTYLGHVWDMRGR